MRLRSVGNPMHFNIYCGLTFVAAALALALAVLAVPARASQGWLDFTSDGRWRSSRLSSAPASGQDRRFDLADLNRDGKLDYAANVAGGVQSALGNGDGTFQPLQSFGDGTSPKGSFALGDLNNDGIPDAVTADVGPGENTVSVFLGDGSGGFGPGFRALANQVRQMGGWTVNASVAPVMFQTPSSLQAITWNW